MPMGAASKLVSEGYPDSAANTAPSATVSRHPSRPTSASITPATTAPAIASAVTVAKPDGSKPSALGISARQSRQEGSGPSPAAASARTASAEGRRDNKLLKPYMCAISMYPLHLAVSQIQMHAAASAALCGPIREVRTLSCTAWNSSRH